ncbi:MAG: 6-carboxytetrahydropterin synthase [Ignavibacteriales bacterium]|nr:6-carboxytetrahydropterin synthase [Ignavibacteriales bacterium]MBI3786836.1 6-carboxytetrahydropterin synthase [Ignavibacteriales bacterium]
MMYVTRRATFSASHRLYNTELSEEQNVALFDKCANAMGHGHNYVLEVTVAGEPRKETGYVIDLKKLKQILQQEILDKVDHKHFNHDVDFMTGIIPTAENIAKAFWRILAPKITEGTLYSIKLHETENNVVEYRGE